jgi:hypothetical protein
VLVRSPAKLAERAELIVSVTPGSASLESAGGVRAIIQHVRGCRLGDAEIEAGAGRASEPVRGI